MNVNLVEGSKGDFFLSKNCTFLREIEIMKIDYRF